MCGLCLGFGLGTCSSLFGDTATRGFGFGSLALQAVADAMVFVEFVEYNVNDVFLDSSIGTRIDDYVLLV